MESVSDKLTLIRKEGRSELAPYRASITSLGTHDANPSDNVREVRLVYCYYVGLISQGKSSHRAEMMIQTCAASADRMGKLSVKFLG